jgi:archaellum component FlaF (FlaF/FlaG flagellin family)
MENKTIVTVNDLLAFNEMMLGRGMPVQEDGIGYNKADYGACANYFYGLSDAQIADLAKRLVKYSNTQLHVDKQIMKDTHEYYASLVNEGDYRENGVSLNITENGTMISFRYNERFIEVIKNQPKRQFDAESKQWIVPNDRVIPVLNELWTVGADVNNALQYAMKHPLMEEIIYQDNRVEVLTKFDGDYALLKFNYNKEIVEAVKGIDRKDRTWNPQFKFWSVKQEHLDKLKEVLSDIAKFKIV